MIAFFFSSFSSPVNCEMCLIFGDCSHFGVAINTICEKKRNRSEQRHLSFHQRFNIQSRIFVCDFKKSKPLHGNSWPCAWMAKGEHTAWVTASKGKRNGIPRRSILVSATHTSLFVQTEERERQQKNALSVSYSLNYFFVKQSSNYTLLPKQSIKGYRFVLFCVFFSE